MNTRTGRFGPEGPIVPLAKTIRPMARRYYSEYKVRAYRLSVEGPDFQLSDNFRLIEAASRDGADLVLVSRPLVLLLQEIRDHFEKKVIVRSWCRSPKHNDATPDSVKNSFHVLGLAADIQVDEVPPDIVAMYAESLEVGGIGWYNTFTHVDVGPPNRRWDYRTPHNPQQSLF